MVVFTCKPSTEGRRDCEHSPYALWERSQWVSSYNSPDLLLWLSYFWQERKLSWRMTSGMTKGPQEGTTIRCSDNHKEWRAGACDTWKAVTPIHFRDTGFGHPSPVGIFVISSQGTLAFSLYANRGSGRSWKSNFLFLSLTIFPNPKTQVLLCPRWGWGIGMKLVNREGDGQSLRQPISL